MDNDKKFELNDEELEKAVGGYAVGDAVRMTSRTIQYCPGCGRLMMNYDATITGVRGVLNGTTIYYIKHNCCGYKTSESEAAIVE